MTCKKGLKYPDIWYNAGIFLLLLTALSMVYARPYMQDLFLYSGDGYTEIARLAFIKEAVQAGEWPLWNKYLSARISAISHPYFLSCKTTENPALRQGSGAFSCGSENLRRFEVSLHNPSCKLHKTIPAGALPYFNALTDTRRCLPLCYYYIQQADFQCPKGQTMGWMPLQFAAGLLFGQV